jgi:hypothetical protein
MMLVVGPTGVGDGLVLRTPDGEGGPGTPFVGVDDGLGLGLGEGDGGGDGEGAPVAPVAPLAPVGPVAPTGVGEGLGSGLGGGEGAPLAPLGPMGPVLEVVDVSPDATAGTTMYIRANIKSVAVSNPRVPDLILR